MNSSIGCFPGSFKAAYVSARHVRTFDLLIYRTLVCQMYECFLSPSGLSKLDYPTNFPLNLHICFLLRSPGLCQCPSAMISYLERSNSFSEVGSFHGIVSLLLYHLAAFLVLFVFKPFHPCWPLDRSCRAWA